MTLKEYKQKYKLRLSDIAEMTGVSVQGVKRWVDAEATIANKGKVLLAVFRPHKSLWESKAYQANSERLGLKQ